MSPSSTKPSGRGKQQERELTNFLHELRIHRDLYTRQAPGHEEIFDDIKALSRCDFDSYRSGITIESRQRPWALTEQMLRRAKRLSNKPSTCNLFRKNEAGWRFGLESEILSRFEIEVVCLDEGLELLFDDRAQERLKIRERLVAPPGSGKEPDRVYGLRRTERIDRILSTEGSDGVLIGESVRLTPFDESEPLLFPFLILEAKSAKSLDSMSKIYAQTALGIRELLCLQRDLANASPENRDAGTNPLVWFLGYKGEQWNVSGAYLEETEFEDGPNYRVLQLWEGNITDEDNALRLLLMVDYIFDWARDVHRKDVIHSLLALASNASASMAADTDVFSTRGHHVNMEDFDYMEHEMPTEVERGFNHQHMFEFFDTDEYAVRDARHMHRNLCALYITKSNINRLLNVAKSPRELQQDARRLWRLITGPEVWALTAECLEEVERAWTGFIREGDMFQQPEQIFLVAFHARSFIAQSDGKVPRGFLRLWNQHHELTYIAIAEDALDSLRSAAAFQPRYLNLDLGTCPRVPAKWIKRLFEEHCFASTRQCFLAAASDSTFHSYTRSDEKGKRDCYPALRSGRLRNTARFFKPYLKTVRQSAAFGSLPWAIYNRLKRGMLDPDESFLRVSQRSALHEPGRKYHRRYWNLKVPDSLDLEGFHAAIVNSDHFKTIGRPGLWYQDHCLFIFEPSLDPNGSNKASQQVKILDEDITSVLKGGSRSQGTRDILRRKRSNLVASRKILVQVRERYESIQSLGPCDDEPRLPVWFHVRSEALCEQNDPSWPYDKLEIVKGIQEMGKSYELGRMLHGLETASDDAFDVVIAALKDHTASLKGTHGDPQSSLSGPSSRKGGQQTSDSRRSRKRKPTEDSTKQKNRSHKRRRTRKSSERPDKLDAGIPSNPIFIDDSPPPV